MKPEMARNCFYCDVLKTKNEGIFFLKFFLCYTVVKWKYVWHKYETLYIKLVGLGAFLISL